MDPERYRAFYRAAPRPHPLQSVAWGEARRLDGWTPEWWLLERRDGTATAGAQVLRRSPPWPVAYLPYGPATDGSPESARRARALLLAIARRGPTGLLWAPPPAGGDDVPAARPGIAVARASTTGLVPLGSDEALRARMRGTWRRRLQHGLADPRLVVRWLEPETSVGPLLERVRTLALERGFAPPVRPEVGAAFAARSAAEGVSLLSVSVEVEGRPSHAFFAALAGDRAQTLWAAQSAGADADAGRVALFALLRTCRERGARSYDLTGIDDVGNPGVASFKRGVGPDLVAVPGLRWLPPAWLPPSVASAAVRARRQGAPEDPSDRLPPGDPE